MKYYVPYLTGTQDVENFLKTHLFSYAGMVNIEECVRYLVHDYFSAKFDSPYRCVQFSNAFVFLKSDAEKLLTVNDTTFIAKVMFQAFWPMQRSFNFILSHCGALEFQAHPTDCYFKYDEAKNLMIYVPTISDPQPANAVPELSLLTMYKGGTA